MSLDHGRVDVQLDRRALDRLVREDPTWLKKVGNLVRDEARSNAAGLGLAGARSSRPEQSIVTVLGEDSKSVYADVGYSKQHPGFYLFWWEVGARDNPSLPHLRPALRPGLF